MLTDRKNFVTGLMFSLIGGSVAVMAYGYDVGTTRNMGAGFFPFFSAIFLVLCGLKLIAFSFGSKASASSIDNIDIKSAVIIIGSLIIFTVMLKDFGLVLSATAMLVLSSLAHPKRNLRSIALLVLVLVPMVCIVFVALLGIPFEILPRVLM